MKKILLIVAFGCIAVGLLGMILTGFNFGEGIPYQEKTWEFQADELQQLIIEGGSSSIDIEFVPSMDGRSYVEYKGNLDQKNFDLLRKAEISNGVLKLNLSQKDVIRFFDLNFSRLDRDIIVALPMDHQLESFSVKMNSANVDIKNGRAKTIIIETSSGNIDIETLIANEAMIKTGSGNIEAEDITANVFVTASSGSIEIEDLRGEGKIETSSGNINIVQRGTNNLDVHASSGDVTITPAFDFSGFYDLQTKSGSIKAPDSKRQSSDVIKVRTSSGNIKIKQHD